MGKCVHMVPGRVRFVLSQVQESPAAAVALAAYLRRVPGVEAVEVRRRSASLVVHHDPRRVSADDLCAVVRGRQEAGESAPVLLSRRKAPAGSAVAGSKAGGERAPLSGPVLRTARHLGGVIGRTAFNVMLEKAVKGGVDSLLRSAARA